MNRLTGFALQPHPYVTLIQGQAEHLPLLSIQDHRSLTQRVGDVAMAVIGQLVELFRLGKYYVDFYKDKELIFLTSTLNEAQNVWNYQEESLPWHRDSESNGLYLFIHGLRGTPLCWGSYLAKLRQENAGAHYIAPYVSEKGNCPLETAAQPFLEIIRNYLKKFPGKPITIAGTSNGARIASFLEVHLTPEELKGTRLNIVSIAGVHYGTKLIDMLSRFYLLPLARLHPKLAEDFHWGSAHAINLLKAWQEKQSVWKQHQLAVRHFFCTTTEDEKIYEPCGSLPLLEPLDQNQASSYQIYSGFTHQTIVPAAREDIFKWIKEGTG